MALTVGDIRKALSKYSDDTLIGDFFGDDFCPGCVCSPVLAKGSFKVKPVGKDSLFNKTWFKADLTGKKVVKIDYSPCYSHEFWTDKDEEASPYWKPQLEVDARRIAKMKPLSYYCSGQLYC